MSIVLVLLFFVFLLGMSLTGLNEYNQEQQEHGEETVGYPGYLTSGHFLEAVLRIGKANFYRWAANVFPTIFLLQKGSPESKSVHGHSPAPRHPKPGHKGRKSWFWENSLTIALVLLFMLSFVLHAVGGSREYCQEELSHSRECPGFIKYAVSTRFWFESFQNWQSEYLAVGVLIILSIFLRQKGSPESKAVEE